jgi:hypothetical protein
MKTLKITSEIEKEIRTSIDSFNRLIKKEMCFSPDLRKQEKIELYQLKISELEKAIEIGNI